MESEEQRPEDVDLGGDPEGADPLANVEPDSVFEEEAGPADADLPPGIEQGTLAGDNPSVEPTPEPDPLDEPPDEFMEDPDQQEVGTPEEPAEPAAESPPTPEPDPQPPEPQPEPAPVPEPTPPETPSEEQPEVATQVGGKEDAETPPPSAGSAGSEGKKATPRRRRRRAAAAKPSDPRDYKPFQQAVGFTNDELGKLAKDGKLWIEHDPIEQRSSTAALRKAYHDLSGDQPGEFVIAAVPAKLWKPKTVSGRALNQMAIEVGD